ncbi:glycosyltransferase family 4 protein [Roseospira visakhapatnamensis]|uniref:Glycosyltransferase involved in cell wall biosynthesis n=1 Tax=Roseospira visakhapatnamensis TaxID=390880 RepID=A0A7W6RBG9_9PROT|nr:glycosyltransferase family 4 protein [Roseospira visakhapatnamensis]MBB4265287.1 glycosyltransferase involved in cell wall biosynthesis [Roseospira visakhapatnamensis]
MRVSAPSARPARPRVVHLLDDGGLGGVTRHIKDVMTSRVAQVFDMERVEVNPRDPWAPRFGADLLHVHVTANWRKLPWLASLRLRHPGVPLVIEEHSYTAAYEALKVPRRRRLRFHVMLRLSYGLADRVVAVSRGQGDWLRRAGVVRPDRCAVVPTTVCTAAFAAGEAARPSGRPLVVGAYGRYAEQKGFDVLVEAARPLDPARIRLVLAGLGPDEGRLRTQAQGLPHVHVGGPVQDVPGFLADVDVVAIPSRWEAFGLVGLEARAAGRPILVSALDGLPEQVADGGGWAVDRHDDPAAWTEALLALTPDSVTRAAVGARRSVADAHRRYEDAWRRLYADLLGLDDPDPYQP